MSVSCILSAHLTTMCRHYSGEIDTVLEMLKDGVQSATASCTSCGRRWSRSSQRRARIWAYLALDSVRLVRS